MKKTIDDNDVEHIASLAALELSDEEKQAHKKHLQKMLDTFEALDRFDVSDVPPTAHILSAVNVLRDDIVAPSYPVDALLENAPQSEYGAYVVPRVVE